MAFSEWQIARLRHRLVDYRKARGPTGGDLSWQRIAMEILTSESLPDEEAARLSQDSENAAAAFAEALRRFANGTQVPGFDRLNAIKLFLIDKGHLLETDLDEDTVPFHAVFAMLEYFGWTTRSLVRSLGCFGGSYEAVREGDGEVIRVAQLELSSPASNGVIQAVEQVTVYADRRVYRLSEASRRRRADNRLMARRATGWVVASDQDHVFLFLRDEVSGAHRCRFVLSSDAVSRALEPPEKVRNLVVIDYVPVSAGQLRRSAAGQEADAHEQAGAWAKAHSWYYSRSA